MQLTFPPSSIVINNASVNYCLLGLHRLIRGYYWLALLFITAREVLIGKYHGIEVTAATNLI